MNKNILIAIIFAIISFCLIIIFGLICNYIDKKNEAKIKQSDVTICPVTNLYSYLVLKSPTMNYIKIDVKSYTKTKQEQEIEFETKRLVMAREGVRANAENVYIAHSLILIEWQKENEWKCFDNLLQRAMKWQKLDNENKIKKEIEYIKNQYQTPCQAENWQSRHFDY